MNVRQKKRDSQKLFITIVVPVVSLCLTFILLYLFVPSERSTSISPPKEVASVQATTVVNELAGAPPVQLKIDSIGVDAIVNPVGLTSTGDMDIEQDPDELAWYKFGPTPGEEGSAVVAGHYGWKDGVPSVFNNLNKLVKGDEILAYGSDGQMKAFVVTRIELYAPNQDATDVFKSDDGKAHLNLITCQGSWDRAAQTYSERLVVFTEYVKDKS